MTCHFFHLNQVDDNTRTECRRVKKASLTLRVEVVSSLEVKAWHSQCESSSYFCGLLVLSDLPRQPTSAVTISAQRDGVGGTSARSCDVPLAHSCVRLSSRVVEPPHCLDTLLTWLCSQILDPPHCLQLHLCGCVRRCSTPGKACTRVF